MRERIITLDGLRFLAALGVLWIHTWTAHGNPRCYVGPIDIANILAIGGNGVDLFFVISGFCMYYFYAIKKNFLFCDFFRFLFKRWVRLSPAFYVATIIYLSIGYLFYNQEFSLLKLGHSVFYLNYLFVQYNTAAHFWTLTVEWQFYFTIPFLLIYQQKTGFAKAFSIIFGSISLIAIISIILLREHSDFLTESFLFHSIEFGFGAIAGRLVILNSLTIVKRLPVYATFIIVLFAGRILVSNPVLILSPQYYNLFKLLGFSLMGLGFAGILYMAVTSRKLIYKILGNKLFKIMGKISYSFYLFHALIFHSVTLFTIKYLLFFQGIWAPIVSTLISAFILYPIALLSYNVLEKPFLSIGNLTTK